MNIDSSHVEYLGSVVVSSSAAELLQASPHHGAARVSKEAFPARNLRASGGKHTEDVYTVVAITQTKIALSATAFTSTDALYTGLTTAFATAVDDGSYATILQDSGVAELAVVTASDPESSPPIIIEPPSSGGDEKGLGDGAIAGIVIGVLAGVAIIAFGVYYYFVSKGGDSLLGTSAREPPGGQAAQEARKTATVSRVPRADRNTIDQDNPVFRGRAKDEAKHSANPVFTGGPRNEML
jgi:hypothetical protein